MVLILGYGNSLRRDDGAGLLLAEKLDRLWRNAGAQVECLLVHQLTPDLAEVISRDIVTIVVFVDTRVASDPGDDLQVHLQRLEPTKMSQSLGHQSDPGSLLQIARDLFGRFPVAWLLTVPGIDFGVGEGLSRTPQEALHQLPFWLAIPATHWDAGFPRP